MRHIPMGNKKPPLAWRRKADALLLKLRNARGKKAREAIITNNSALWRELREWLWKQSHKKCWFSEAKDCFSHWEVEHYRPKLTARSLKGAVSSGYWWLAFDYTNFRLCGNAGNRKKGTYFPLRKGCRRARPFSDLRHEVPMLLDPVDEDDPSLLGFDSQGHAIPAPHVQEQWEKDRVLYSIDRCNLQFPALVDKRKARWAECWRVISDYQRELAEYHKNQRNLIALHSLKRAAKRLRELLHEKEELSSVARACVLSSGDARVIVVLQNL